MVPQAAACTGVVQFADRIRSIRGVYVPFWLYDLNARVRVNATGTKVHKYRSGDFLITETDYYDVYRELDLHYVLIPVDASVKMDDNLMDQLEPFQYNEMKDFQPAYLSGFQAERYQIPDTELLQRAESKVIEHIREAARGCITGYDSVSGRSEDIRTQCTVSRYVLLPVWHIAYDWHGTRRDFYINGQTGKVVGKAPFSAVKTTVWFGGIASALMIAMKVWAYKTGGVMW
jgi:hypothetical protein